MGDFKKLAHAIWQCKYHVVWCPKYRFRILNEEKIRKYVRWQLEKDRRMEQLKFWR
ncbi:MAG: transposase [Desulfatiglandaceae bacterium]|jgi:REP element-mobilizing transposase RayT